MNIEQRVELLQQKVKEFGAEGIVFNLGWDVESAVMAHLAHKAFPGKSIAVWAGTQSPNKRHFLRNMESSGMLYDWVNVEYGLGFSKLVKQTFELENPYQSVETMTKYFYEHTAEADMSYKEHKDINYIIGNMKNRFKANVAMSHAEKNNYLMVSSLSKTKFETGLFTIGGEDAGFVAPLIDLTRTEIVELAKELGVNPVVINETPTRGFFEGQTDEADLGVSYEAIDKHLKGEANAEVQALIDNAKAKKARVNLQSLA